MARNCRNSSVSLATYYIVARSVRITLNSSLKIRAAMNLDLDNRPDCSNMVRNRAWPASSRLTVSRRMAGFDLGNLPPFPRVRGRFFSLFIYTFFMWYNSTGWHCRRLFLPHNLRLRSKLQPPARASVFCCKTEWCCKKHSLLCSGEHKSFLSEEERALSGESGD